MTTLIINVDRDNDFGDKAGVNGPVVGYTECYNAALKLITADPEDSDSNALFGALKVYEDLKKKGEDVEIALLTGDNDVGEKSDEILSKQVAEVTAGGEYSDAILVSDGAEDDYIVPVILSYIKIRYVKHIIVRHNENIESIYYYIVKALKDKKIVNKFIIPLGLVFLTYGLVSLVFILYSAYATGVKVIDPTVGAITFVTLVLGVYLLERGFDLIKVVSKFIREVHEYAQDTRILFFTYIIAGLLVLVGIASSYTIAVRTSKNDLDAFLIFLSLFTWWVYGAIFTSEVGRVTELAVGRKVGILKIWYGLIFSLSIAFVVYGMFNYIRYILGFISLKSGLVSIFFLILGLIIAIISSMVHRYFNENPEIQTELPGLEQK
ncbi:hypothetical protein [Thermoplasma volcanium GSS1]|uniref:DUF373 family protein n=1 Tax=Thermoplasma volcanium (strain ATCC 51530 / DSM 4299 / JCM 9571 / NBRC 15438 / GSS1) TaxID=273116 RepID=Q978E4_THEVO|nr:DUF373 family protein [Thermoplasma volcanium]BAB60615.1 hypothetical protein [Thermoplasma volcanium GSS1]